MTWLLVHTLGQVVAALGIRYWPGSLAITMALTALIFPYSIMTGADVLQNQPVGRGWLLVCTKWVLIVVCASVPSLLCKALHVGPKVLHRMGIYMTISVALNVMWTLFHGLTNALEIANGLSALTLALALLIRGVDLVRRGERLAELSSDGWPRFRTTTASWVVSYTVWNIAFIAQLSVHHVFQAIAFIILMAFAYHCSADRSEDFGFEFIFCRSVSLGAYCSIEMFRDFVENSVPPQGEVYWMFLFVAYLNACASTSILARGVRDMWISFATLPAELGSAKSASGEHT